MDFICKPCREAADTKTNGDPLAIALKRQMHKNCRGGTWCDCLHRVKS